MIMIIDMDKYAHLWTTIHSLLIGPSPLSFIPESSFFFLVLIAGSILLEILAKEA